MLVNVKLKFNYKSRWICCKLFTVMFVFAIHQFLLSYLARKCVCVCTEWRQFFLYWNSFLKSVRKTAGRRLPGKWVLFNCFNTCPQFLSAPHHWFIIYVEIQFTGGCMAYGNAILKSMPKNILKLESGSAGLF